MYVVYSIFVKHKSCEKSGISENFPVDNENKTSHNFKTHHILICTKSPRKGVHNKTTHINLSNTAYDN